MALEGTLKDFSPFDILELIDFKQKTGLLFVTSSEGETITLGFEKKGIVLAQSSSKHLDMQLGSILIRSGRLKKADRDKALLLQKGTLDRLGFILEREKFCSKADICASLRVQMKRVFFSVLRWKEGIYIFEPRESIEYFHEFVKPIFVEPLNVKSLMMEGAVMIDEWPMVEKVVPSMDIIFRKTANAPIVIGMTEEQEFDFELKLKDTEGKVYVTGDESLVFGLVNGKRTVGDIFDQTLFSEFSCCKIFYDLTKRKLIEKGTAKAESAGKFEKRTASSPNQKNELPKSKKSKTVQKTKENDHWEEAQAMLLKAFPDAIIMELGLSKREVRVLQGETDPVLWLEPVASLMKELQPLDGGSYIGTCEYIGEFACFSFFWNRGRDIMLVAIAKMDGSSLLGASRFRAHTAMVTRLLLT